MTIALRYTVLAGDTFSSIAAGVDAAAGVTYQQIEAANPGLDPTRLAVGQVIAIPALKGGGVALRYTILSGDTLSSIAAGLAQCGEVTATEIAAANPGVVPEQMPVGAVIAVPSTAGGEPSAPSAPVNEPVSGAAVVDYYYWTWNSAGCAAPAGTTLGLAFSGWTDPDTALQQSSQVYDRLEGAKYITLGGGNSSGAWSSEALAGVVSAIDGGRFAAYRGIGFDVEEGDSGLEGAFAAAFAAAKAKGLRVLVTVSHSAPYGIGDAATLMSAFFADANIDYLSPQLYTTGEETANDYATSHGVSWSDYAASRAAVVPSIVSSNLYADARSYFAQQGVEIQGYVRWSQSG